MKLEAAMNALHLWMRQAALEPDRYRVTITADDSLDLSRIEAAAFADLGAGQVRLDMAVPGRMKIAGITLQFGDKLPPRTDKDYAVEFGGYLADAADHLLALIYETPAGDSMSGVDAQDHLRVLKSTIYEFRKRAAKAKA